MLPRLPAPDGSFGSYADVMLSSHTRYGAIDLVKSIPVACHSNRHTDMAHYEFNSMTLVVCTAVSMLNA